jgi:hypothetical protein
MKKKSAKKVAKDLLEKDKFSLVGSKVGPVLKTNLDLDELVIMLDPIDEEDLMHFQVINQSTGEIYLIEKEIKLVNIENRK